jgi:amino acid adenylation domain-containing protein
LAHALHHLLERAARERPGGVAVVDRDRAMTYGELDAAANRLARRLVAAGVGRGDRVGLFLDKSLESVVGIYAASKAGAAYVPVDPGAPPARAAYILDDCGVRVLLTGTERAAQWPLLVEHGAGFDAMVVLNGDAARVPSGVAGIGADEVAGGDDTRPAVAGEVVDPDLAYVLYTSGSTGRPKGVKLTHRNALHFVEWAAAEVALTSDDRLSSHAPLHFDLSVFDLFAAAAAGAAVVLVPPRTSTFPPEVARFIEEQAITVWYSVPSVLGMLALRGGLSPGRCPSLRAVLFAGEVFPTPHLRRLMELLPAARFLNLYGPTETNVCTWYEVPGPPPDDAPVPIGRAITNVEVFAVTDDGRRAAVGEEGELCVRGTTVMQGYWGDPERTARSLIANPWAPEAGDAVYRTGDVVVEAADGNFHYVGRRDSQVKSRGYRIELGEIEAALHAHPAVVECVACAVPDELVTNRLRAVVVVSDGTVDAAALARFCAERLPSYMVPELVVESVALPRTSTGKIDRRAVSEALGR